MKKTYTLAIEKIVVPYGTTSEMLFLLVYASLYLGLSIFLPAYLPDCLSVQVKLV